MRSDSWVQTARSTVAQARALRQSALFESLDQQGIEEILYLCELREFEPREVICRAGEAGDSLWVLVRGVVEAHTGGPDDLGRLIAKQRRGDVVGVMSILTGQPRSATVVASLPTQALEFRSEDFARIVRAYPSVLLSLNQILSRRLVAANVQHAERDAGVPGEAVAVFLGAALAGSIEQIHAATEAASPGTVSVVDARERVEDAIGRLDDLTRRDRTVLFVGDLDQEELPQLLDHVDRAVAIVASDAEAKTTAALAARPDLEEHPIEVVLIGDDPETRPRGLTQVQGSIPVTRVVGGGNGGDAGPLPPRDLAWLGRHLARAKLGLALGAGGARGYAHIGALRVLEREGYTIDYVSGSSIGAIVAALIAFGMNADDIDAVLRKSFDAETNAELFKLGMSGGSTGLEKMKQILRDMTMGQTFDAAQIPLTIMAVDLVERRPAPLREGLVHEALLAATALAGMFPPYEMEGQRLVDGLALVPVPTGSVIEDGADVTVSINLMSAAALPAWPGEDPPPPPEARRRRPGMLDTILEVMDLAQVDSSARHAAVADVVLTPEFGPNSWRDFHLADQFLEAGRVEAERQLPALQALAGAQQKTIPT